VYRLAKRFQPAYFNLLRARATAVRAVTAGTGLTGLVQNPVAAATVAALCSDAAASARAGLRALPIHPDIRASRTLPPGLDADKREAFERVQNAHSDEAVVYLLADGRSWGADGAVLTRDRQLIGNLSPVIRTAPDAHPIFRRPIFQKPRRIEGRVGVLTGPSPDNLSHWLFGVLPRVCLLRQGSGGLNGFDWFITPRVRTAFQAECLKRYGVPETKMIQADPAMFVEARELVAPSFVSAAFVAPVWFLEDLRQRFSDVPPAAGSPRIYISRRSAPGRRVTNEAALTTLLEALDFKIVQFERLPFLEQVSVAKGAQIIVSAHGAALSYLAFAAAGAGVLELFSSNYVNAMYWCLADELGLDYRCWLTPSTGSPHKDLVRDNIQVDLRQFEGMVRSLVSAHA
jgi:capsular polysaccharide biosynthesis protein